MNLQAIPYDHDRARRGGGLRIALLAGRAPTPFRFCVGALIDGHNLGIQLVKFDSAGLGKDKHPFTQVLLPQGFLLAASNRMAGGQSDPSRFVNSIGLFRGPQGQTTLSQTHCAPRERNPGLEVSTQAEARKVSARGMEIESRIVAALALRDDTP